MPNGTPSSDKGLTVTALINSADRCAEALQVVAGQWRIRDSFDTFAAVDAGKTDGLDTRDGRYVYYCPGYRPGRPNGSSRLWGDIGRLRVAVRAMSAAEIAEDQERCPQTF